MFSYYGSKSRVVNLYPPPKYGCIIEPFAGSARYSLKYFDRDITLVDKYEVVVDIWKYLQQCSKSDIMGLPVLCTGMKLDKLNISEQERKFLGMISGIASLSPRNTVSKFSGEQNGRKNKMLNIANQLYKIKHWNIICGDYEQIANKVATWFIDPPYQFGGSAYIENKINFTHLSEWIISRQGQVIACENTRANWMDFKPMSLMRGANRKHTTEAIWSNIPTNYDIKQQKLFL